MAKVGRFIESKFKNKIIEFTFGMTAEWIEYSDHTAINDTVMSGIVCGYDEESGVVTFRSTDTKSEFYISEELIGLFWQHGRFDLLEHASNVLNTGRKYSKNDRDIM